MANNPAAAASAKLESTAKNFASQALGALNNMQAKLALLQTMKSVTKELNLGALSGKLGQVGLAQAILQKAVPGNILPTLNGAMGAVQIIKNVSEVLKEAKKASKGKSGIGDEDKAAEEKQKAAEEKAKKQKEKEEARDKAKEEKEKAKKEAGEADVAALDSKIEQASQNAKSSDNLQKDSLDNLTSTDVPDYNMITPDDDLLVTRVKQEAQMKQFQSMGNVSNAGSVNNSSSNNFGYSGDILKGFNQDSGGYNFNGYSLAQQPKQTSYIEGLLGTQFSTDSATKASSTFGGTTSSTNITSSSMFTQNASNSMSIEKQGTSINQNNNLNTTNNGQNSISTKRITKVVSGSTAYQIYQSIPPADQIEVSADEIARYGNKSQAQMMKRRVMIVQAQA